MQTVYIRLSQMFLWMAAPGLQLSGYGVYQDLRISSERPVPRAQCRGRIP